MTVPPYQVAFPQATPASTFPPCKATPASAIVICMLKGLTEPDYGNDASALRATATKVEGGWVLEGQKRWIRNSTFADVLFLLGIQQQIRLMGIFIVKKNAPGLTATKIENKIGLRIVQNGDILLNKVFVPDEEPGVNSFQDTNKVSCKAALLQFV
ncbi:hypothetical protein ACFX1T_009836 [Malus domestica]